MTFKNRVIEYRLVKGSELIPNERNYRKHPKAQKKAYEALVAEIGFAGANLAYVLEDGSLKLIDGHMRSEIHTDDEIPVLVTDLNEAEANALLRMFDPLAAMADTAEDLLAELNADVMANFPALEESLVSTAEALGVEELPDDFPEYTEDVADGVKMCTCPECGHEFPV